MSQHTPGPWRWCYGRGPIERPRAFIHRIAKTDELIAEVADAHDANARLIAAAPELLDALEVLADWIHVETHGQHVALPAVDAIIAKAKGEG